MTKIMPFLITVLVTVGYFHGQSMAQAGATDVWHRLQQGGVAVLIRHALAPGVGDPSTFKLDDCSTQRNLSDAGRQQARDIGAAFRQNGIAIDNIYTSQWCRCRETADLLGLGPVMPLPILNSFFENREREPAQTKALTQFLKTVLPPRVVVLVTHQVNITALTGVYPTSGEAVVVDLQPDKSRRVLGTLSFPLKPTQTQ